MPRTQGSKNKSQYHQAGGARKGSGPKPKAPLSAVMKNPFERLPLHKPPPVMALPSNAQDGHSHIPAFTSSESETISHQPDHPFDAMPPSLDHFTTISDVPKISGTGAMMNTDELPFDLSAYETEAQENIYGCDDDDDDSSYEDDELVDDDDDDEVNSNRRVGNQYMPPNDSPLDIYLRRTKEKIINDPKYTIHGCHWAPPVMDPLSDAKLNMEKWYFSSEVWVYCWLPFRQYSSRLNRGTCPCIYCAKQSCVQSKGEMRYRPFFYFDKIVWVLHGRLFCADCKKSFTEIDPRFLSNLPTNITERFPFISSRKGPGIHTGMMVQFLALCTDGILFAKYCDSINQMQRLRYDMSRIGYLDEMSDLMNHGLGSTMRIRPEIYPVFNSPGHYNGIILTPRLMKRFFLLFMRTRSSYHQTSFQFCNDEGAAADHSHKFSKKVTCGKRLLFNASYSIMSLSGQVSSLRLTFGKSNDEIEPVLNDLKKARINVGVSLLKRFETDNLKGDGGLWNRIFPELKEGISTPPSSVDDRKASVSETSIDYIDSISAANTWALTWVDAEEFNQPKDIIIGLDTEWCPMDPDPHARLLQIQVEKFNTAVFNLSKMGVSEGKAQFPNRLRDFLQDPRIVVCGVNIGVDCAKLQRFEVMIKKRIDIRHLALKHSCDQPEGLSLQALAKKYLGLIVDKSLQCEDWKQDPLPKEMIRYAALDCLLSKQLVDILKGLLQESSVVDDNIRVGTFVDYIARNIVIARGYVSYLGGGGNQFKWGNHTIGQNKAMFTLTEIWSQGHKLPLKHPHPHIITFGDIKKLEDKRVGVRTSSLRVTEVVPQSPFAQAVLHEGVRGLDMNHTVGQSQPTSILERTSQYTEWIQGQDRAKSTYEKDDPDHGDLFFDCETTLAMNPSNLPTPQVNINTDDTNVGDEPDLAKLKAKNDLSQHVLDSEVDFIDEDDDYGELSHKLYSRGKEDIFHVFKNLPLAKTCPIRRCIINLLIVGTFSFVQEDYDAYTSYLKLRFSIEESETLSHFFNNKEEWRQYVRMIVHQPSAHAQNIKSIHHFMKTNEETSSFYNDDVKDYFNTFETKCRNGLFEEINDVQMFQWAGIGKGGLDRWYRRRGTVRNENLHQKLFSCLGAHSIGAEVGHHLLVLLAYKYNISTGIKRLGLCNHGHIFYEYIDRIQIRLQEIYNVVVYPSHRNCSLLINPITNFIAVGIGPLSYDNRFVTFGPAHKNLRGDLRFVASSMGLELPPLEISSKEERTIFNDYRRNHPQNKKLSASSLVELAIKFKCYANGTTIFPKLPSQLEAYDRNFQKISVVTITARNMSIPYNQLLSGLMSTDRKRRFDFLNEEDEDEEAESFQIFAVDPSFVPPISAPLQKHYIVSKELNLSSQESRKCVFYPIYCNKTARECGGQRLDQPCTTIIKEKVALPTNYRELLIEAKRLERNGSKRNRKAANRNAANEAVDVDIK